MGNLFEFWNREDLNALARSAVGLCVCFALTMLLPVGVEAGHRGLDPTALVDWFGGRVTSGFHDPARPYHGGIDFGLAAGTPVRSTWEGTVVYAGWGGGYGNLVIVQNGDWRMYYAHLSQFSVRAGQLVQIGAIIGLSGNTGKSSGAHLHYEVRCRGVPVDPMTAPGVASGHVCSSPGESIELRVWFPKTGLDVPWQQLWTVVQWQDGEGVWHDVEGWRGTLDEVAGGVGRKVWWVAGPHLGKGPFRWVVYRDQAQVAPLTRSAPFHLPDVADRSVVTAVWLSP
jgi:hypothetical protein